MLSGMPKRTSAGASAEAREAVEGGERWGAEQSHEELCHVAAHEGLLQRCATPDGEAAIGGKDWIAANECITVPTVTYTKKSL